MIKRIILIFTLIMLISAIPVMAIDTYGGYKVPVDIEINGSFIKCVQKPVMINGSTYIPLRAFGDAVGAGISWDENEKSAELTKDNHTFVFYSEKNHSVVDGVQSSFFAINYGIY